MWTAQELESAFGPDAPKYCKDAGTFDLRRPASADGTPASFVFTEPGGGYKISDENAAIPSTCDFDIVNSMSPAEFQHTYVSPRRPVLVRRGTEGKFKIAPRFLRCVVICVWRKMHVRVPLFSNASAHETTASGRWRQPTATGEALC